MNYLNRILHGDCEEVLKGLPDACVDLIFTSPPYADQRQSTYGGVSPDEYVDWLLPKVAQFQRVLKPTGTFILNIKERVVQAPTRQPQTRVYRITRKRYPSKSWWLMWHKKNS